VIGKVSAVFDRNEWMVFAVDHERRRLDQWKCWAHIELAHHVVELRGSASRGCRSAKHPGRQANVLGIISHARGNRAGKVGRAPRLLKHRNQGVHLIRGRADRIVIIAEETRPSVEQNQRAHLLGLHRGKQHDDGSRIGQPQQSRAA
jgi:hypothetical protein